MYILLALAASVVYGGADFLGAVASRRSAALAVSAVSQAVGLVAMAVALLLLPAAHPTRADVVWGIATGAAGACSLGFFFSALAVGRIGVVAPIAAAIGAAVPVLVGIAFGDRPGIVVWTGIVLAVGAIVLIGWEPNAMPVAGDDEGGSAPRFDRSVVLAVAAGLAIGAFYTFLRRTTTSSGLWPLLITRAVSCPLLFAAARIGRQPLTSLRGVLMIVVAGGLLDIAANVCYFVAVHLGPLGVVATLASLYPAATVILAYAMLGERLHRRQLAGLAVGAVAIVLISAHP
jgi:drug/metabolite transporter (DMT)-like permease